MTRIRDDQLLLPSVFDRLINENPNSREDSIRSRSQLLRELKLSVRRDLENLLNTRLCLVDVPPELEHLQTSLVNYGIPDFGGLSAGSQEQREQLRARVEETIRRFETRFQYVRVELARDRQDRTNRTLRFRIEGTLHAEPAPEPVLFDSHMTAPVGEFRVRNADL